MPKKDYSAWTKEELIQRIHALEKRKKYGLVWDEEKTKERFEKDAEGKLPVLKDIKEKEIKNDDSEPVHILIEGDNFHALSVLNYTHKNLIDVIYIDPPYNTGSTAWIYNNKYVDSEDTYKHSKWIEMMYKRLKLAKNLLTNRGILICAIDDYEHHNLRHILDELFLEENRLGTVVVIHNPGGRQDDKFIATAHEYMLIYAKNKDEAMVKHLDITQKKMKEYLYEDEDGKYKLREYRRSGNNSRRQDRPKMWYSIYIHPKTLELNIKPFEGAIELLPIDPNGIERVWRWGKETFMKRKDKYIEVKKVNGGYSLHVKERLSDNKGEKPKTLWNKSTYSATNGTNELKKILKGDINGGKLFEYPKSPFLMYDILKAVTYENSIVLDFFAGSGTTGQAVMQLNKIEGGTRQFILCTNNEVGPKKMKELTEMGLTVKEIKKEGVCEKVTYPRISNLINGYYFTGIEKEVLYEKKINLKLFRLAETTIEEIEEIKKKHKLKYDSFKTQIKDGYISLIGIKEIKEKVEGFGVNLKYFKTAFVPAQPTDKNKELLTRQSVEMLCLRENTFDFVKETEIWKIYRNRERHTGILFDQMRIPVFKKELKRLGTPVSVYVFSLGDDDFSEEFSDLENVKVCSIPEAILRVYRKIFK